MWEVSSSRQELSGDAQYAIGSLWVWRSLTLQQQYYSHATTIQQTTFVGLQEVVGCIWEQEAAATVDASWRRNRWPSYRWTGVTTTIILPYDKNKTIILLWRTAGGNGMCRRAGGWGGGSVRRWEKAAVSKHDERQRCRQGGGGGGIWRMEVEEETLFIPTLTRYIQSGDVCGLLCLWCRVLSVLFLQ